MRLSTSTCIHERVQWSKELVYTCQESIEACAKAGYKVLDMNFASYSRGSLPMTQPDWESWVREIKELADSLGVEWMQGHAHFNSQGIAEWDDELIRRLIIGAGILGVKWLVIHPVTVKDDVWYSHEKSFQVNLESYKKYGELASKYNVGICLENMFDGREVRRYCCSVEELVELYDTLNDSSTFGICWDTGHASLMKIDQAGALRKLGKRLKALHINDNRSEYDDHIAPYFGLIQWDPILQALKDIEYEGDFTFEIHNFTNGLPHELHERTLRFTYELGQHMLDSIK